MTKTLQFCKQIVLGFLVTTALLTLLAPAHAATFNLFSPASGILKGTPTSYVTTSASVADLVALFSGTCSSSTFLRGDGTCNTPVAGTGTVTSVGMTVPTFLSVSGSPVTTSGTLAVTLSGTALPASSGGLGMTTVTDDTVAVANGTTWQSKALTDCDAATSAVTYDTTANAFGCNTINGATGANPTGTIGLTAVNGVATTFLRSDGAPALSQAIAPTWTGSHIFTAAPGTSTSTTAASIGAYGGTQPVMRWTDSAAASNGKVWDMYVSGTGLIGRTINDAGNATANWLSVIRSGNTISTLSLGNASDNPTYTFLGSGTTTFGGVAQIQGGNGITLNNGSNNATASIRNNAGSGNSDLTLRAGGADRLTVGNAGNVTIGAPSSGTALVVNQASGSTYGLGVSAASGVSSSLNIDQTSVATWAVRNIATSGTFAIRNAAVGDMLTITQAGNMAVSAPSSGSTLTLNGITGTLSRVVDATGSTTAGIYSSFSNNGGVFYSGVERSTGGNILSGAPAYASVIGSANATDLSLGTNSTERFRINTSGALGIGGATYGSSGQVLTSGGASAAPTWTTVANSTTFKALGARCSSTGAGSCTTLYSFGGTSITFSSRSTGTMNASMGGWTATPACTATSTRGASVTTVMEIPTLNSSAIVVVSRDTNSYAANDQEFYLTCMGT